ncbi:hypothetical protein [uncultured Oscillibacter sp.]|uniref:hypothetical protein n=1 Tax=uncultured Oscillibacter sp. TaxID=876091 RepID=UPI0025F932DA|nr:hypothetical protein [uncultured Oscillibacter sp.]
MKIRDAKQMYSVQLDALRDKRQALSKLLKDQEKGGPQAAAFDRVEISKELSRTDAQYDALSSVMEGITARETAIHDLEASKQQNETLAKAAEDMVKIMEVYRRIASGAKVPAKDEKKLMDYDFKLYMAAKQAALIAKRDDEEYDSLWEDEDEQAGEQADPSEIAGSTEISVPDPSAVAASAEASSEEIV